MTEHKRNVDIREIKYDTAEYRKELKLRDEVLRKPLGLSLYDEQLEAEKKDFHIGAFLDDKTVGVLILTRLNATAVKMRQVAVDEKWRAKKTGSKLVGYAEEYSKNKGYENMLLHARKSAVGFYEKLGYEKISEEFQEIHIPHYEMRKHLFR